MIENYIRAPYQKLLVTPIAARISHKLSPTQLTLLAAISGFLVLPLLMFGFNKSACLALIISGYLDTLDGTLARMQNRADPKGAMLDIISDRFVEFVVILGLFMVAPATRGTLCLLMLGSILICVSTFLVVGIFNQNQSAKSFYYHPGLMERLEAFGFFLAMILLPALFNYLAILFMLLVTFTAVVRMVQFHNASGQ